MIVTFDKEYLKELYETGKASEKKYRFQPDIIARYQKRIDQLLDAFNIQTLCTISSLHYEELKGDKKGISSIRVNDKYRIEFTVTDEDAEPVVTVCNILDPSNHYK